VTTRRCRDELVLSVFCPWEERESLNGVITSVIKALNSDGLQTRRTLVASATKLKTRWGLSEYTRREIGESRTVSTEK